jgi:prepilin-type N-terminal cleavage/methylation domain-containing protein
MEDNFFMKLNFKYNRKAFTLVELLIVIAIIGILFVVLVSKVDFATDKAKATGVQTDFRSFQVAFETVSRENSGFNTLGWDTGDNAGGIAKDGPVTINGVDSNKIELNWPNRTIEIEVHGHYSGQVPMDLELSIYSDNEVLVAKKTPSLSTGETLAINNSDFSIKQKIELPVSFTNGVYHLQIDLTHPKVAYLAQAFNAVQLNVDGNYTPMGIPVDQRYFGLLYL